MEVSKKELGHKNTNQFIDLLAHDIDCNKALVGTKQPLALELRDYQQAIVQWILRKEQAESENGTSHAILKEWFRWKQNYKAGSRYFCESLFWASQPKQAAKT